MPGLLTLYERPFLMMNADYPVSLQDLHRLDNLDLIARQVVEGFVIGMHKSPFHGFSVEFAEHRLYNPGENLRSIDWKVYARTDRMYVKKFEEETNLRCRLVLDTSASMYYPLDAGSKGQVSVNKLNFSVACASALAYLFRKQRDAFGLTLFSDQVQVHTNARSTEIQYELLLSNFRRILAAKPLKQVTNLAATLHQVAENIHKRSLVVIFSDMFDNASSDKENQNGLYESLRHLKYNKHEVILFHVVDRNKELAFTFDNRPYLFIDMETGEKVKLSSNEVRKQYVEQAEAYEKQLKLKCQQYKIDFIAADINKSFRQVLLPYLLKRSKLG